MDIQNKSKLCFIIVLLTIFTVISIIVFLPKKVDYKTQVRSSDLIEKTTEDGNIQRTDYFDENGKLTFADNKHYATIIKTTSGNSLLEEYYD